METVKLKKLIIVKKPKKTPPPPQKKKKKVGPGITFISSFLKLPQWKLYISHNNKSRTKIQGTYLLLEYIHICSVINNAKVENIWVIAHSLNYCTTERKQSVQSPLIDSECLTHRVTSFIGITIYMCACPCVCRHLYAYLVPSGCRSPQDCWCGTPQHWALCSSWDRQEGSTAGASCPTSLENKTFFGRAQPMFSHFSYAAQHSARIRHLIHLISKYHFAHQNFSWLFAHAHVPGHFNENKELSDRDGYITGLVHGCFPQVHQQILSVLTQRPHLHCCGANHILEFYLCLFTPTLCLNTHTMWQYILQNK